MVAAGASAASSIDGLGIRFRVRGSSVSMNPVSRKSRASDRRSRTPRSSRHCGARTSRRGVDGIVRRRGARHRHRRQRRDLLRRLGRFCGLTLCLRRTVQEHVVDHLVEIDRDLLVADGLRHFADQPARALRDLDEVQAGLRELFRKGSHEHRIGIVVVVRQTIERGLSVSPPCTSHPRLARSAICRSRQRHVGGSNTEGDSESGPLC